MKSVREALSPILFLSRFFGYKMLEYPAGRSRPLFSVFYVTFKWTLYLYIVHLNTELFTVSFKNNIFAGVFFTGILINFAISVATLYQNKILDRCLDSLAAVESTLRMVGISNKNSRLREFVLKVIGLWLSKIAITYALDVTYILRTYSGSKDAYYAPVIYDYPRYANDLFILMFYTILWYTGTRFDKLNERIREMAEHPYQQDYRLQTRFVHWLTYRRLIQDEQTERTVWTIMQLHTELCKILRELNLVFQTQMCLEVGSCFIFLIMSVTYFAQTLLKLDAPVSSKMDRCIEIGIWFVLCLANIFGVNHVCHVVTGKGNAMKRNIDVLVNSLTESQLRKEVAQFSLRMMQSPLRFTGHGLFYFGYTMIRRVFASILVVIIIMLQMDAIPDENS